MSNIPTINNFDFNENYGQKPIKEIKPKPNAFVLEKDGKQTAIGVKSSNVNLNTIQEPLEAYMFELSELTGSEGLYKDVDLLITSGDDGKHSKNSKHYVGGALDLRISSEYRKDRASVYKSPQYMFFQTPEVKALNKKYGVRVLDPLHHKLDTEEATVQNAHMHVELLAAGHYHGDGHDHSKDFKIEEDVKKDSKLENVKEGSFEGELEYELMLEELKRQRQGNQIDKQKTEKQLLKNNILNKIGELKGFSKVKVEEQVVQSNPQDFVTQIPLNSLSGISEIPDQLVFN